MQSVSAEPLSPRDKVTLSIVAFLLFHHAYQVINGNLNMTVLLICLFIGTPLFLEWVENRQIKDTSDDLDEEYRLLIEEENRRKA